MTSIYELLVEMGYLNQEDIAYPPHSRFAINTTLAKDLGLSSKGIELLQKLPYVSADYQNRFGAKGFLLESDFIDLRNEDHLRQSRDPFSGETTMYFSGNEYMWGNYKSASYMKPWHLALNRAGSGTVMVLNVNNCKLLQLSQDGVLLTCGL
jgi:hypothetical protein